MAWIPLARRAVKYTPVALAFARQLDRQLRPHVLAYRLARDVDGFVGRWTSDEGNHYAVFPSRQGAAVRVFPPLRGGELKVLDREIDRASLRHHAELPEARLSRPGELVRRVGVGIGRRRRGGGEPPPDPSTQLPPPRR